MLLHKLIAVGSFCVVAPMVTMLSVGCSSGDPASDDGGVECDSDADCKGDRICEEGACVDPEASATSGAGAAGTGPSSSSGAPSTSSGSGGSCGDAGESCPAAGCCAGNTCTNFDEGDYCAADCTENSGCQSGCCAPLENGGGVCAPTSYCGPTGPAKGIGEACGTDTECGSGNCIGWCTQFCGSSSDCPGTNWCVTNGADQNVCFPYCTGNSDCYAFPGTTCQTAYTVDGLDMNVCSS